MIYQRLAKVIFLPILTVLALLQGCAQSPSSKTSEYRFTGNGRPMLLPAAPAQDVNMHYLKVGERHTMGVVSIVETPEGLVFIPRLNGLTPGRHGFHIHEVASCAMYGTSGKAGPAVAAGGHFDPEHTGKHLGPYQGGHLGDLPYLLAGNNGRAWHEVLAPRLKSLNEIKGRSLVIYRNGDNYSGASKSDTPKSDTPKLMGGGGARIACGVIE